MSKTVQFKHRELGLETILTPSVVTMVDQAKGSVKWFNKDKGYGFITVNGRAKDVFFHAKEWNAAALNTLPIEGEQLSFTITPGPKGEYATNILRSGAPNATRIGEPT